MANSAAALLTLTLTTFTSDEQQPKYWFKSMEHQEQRLYDIHPGWKISVALQNGHEMGSALLSLCFVNIVKAVYKQS